MFRLQINKLSKSYPTRRVLRPIDLEMTSGVLALLGANGAGKTTLLHMLSTQLQPTSGHFVLNDYHSQQHAMDIRRCVGMVGHKSFLYHELTLQENLRLYGQLYGVSRLDEQIVSLSEQFALTERLSHRVGQFSRGLQQRASLIRMLLHDPKLLLLDEPFTGLDWSSTQLLLRLISEWKDPQRLIIVTTHDLEQAAHCADRFVILRKGQISADIQHPLSASELKRIYEEHTNL